MNRLQQTILVGATLALTGAWSMPSFALESAAQRLGRPVDAGRLDSMRGGFVMPTGGVVSFGIERIATVNGERVTALRVDIPDLARITPEQARSLAAFRETRVIQVGEGARVLPRGDGALVIQNALDGQRLATLTTINVSVDTLGLFQDLNLAASLQAALTRAPTSL